MYTELFLIAFLIVLFIILFLKKKKNDHRKERFNLSKIFFGNKNETCKDIMNSSSTGILTDSAIVCKIAENIDNTPEFYYEEIPKDVERDSWVFVNLDITNFDFISKFSNTCPETFICKTKQTYDILYHKFPEKRILYTGFTSIDKYDENIKKNYRQFLHVAGKSPYKGTEILLNTWILHPEYPLLIIVCRDEHGIETKCRNIIGNKQYNNIILKTGFIDSLEMNHLINSSGIHICISEHEGFGHYIYEAKSCKAVVLYTNAQSMNENFINGFDGIAVNCYQDGYSNFNICPRFKPTIKQLEYSVNYTLNLNQDSLEKIGNNARFEFLKMQNEFQNRLIYYLEQRNNIPKKIHYIWLSKENAYINVDLPDKYNKYIDSIKYNNKNFDIKFWSGEDIIKLINLKFPSFLDFYKKLPLICKCDFARFLIIYLEGGVYIDVDFFCRKNLEPLLKDDSYFIYEPEEHIQGFNKKLLTNGFFALSQYHFFAIRFLKYMYNQKMIDNSNLESVINFTGPMALNSFYEESKIPIYIGNTCDIIPYTIKGDIVEKCKNRYNGYCITLWGDGSDWAKQNNVKTYFKYETNPLNNKKILFTKEDKFPLINKDEINIFQNKFDNPILAILISHYKLNIEDNTKIIFDNKDSKNKEFVEKIALLNGLSNLIIL